ncbi:MAG: flagellar biosynthetic protein FliO [Proteobacteria bacterium]|jgi:flagellar biogenesis protein FliO|nr:flagellar biosynthetic protein FliO [Pseudomonadota bacterium]
MMDAYLNVIKVVFVLLGIISGMALLYRYAGKFKLNLKPGKSEYNLKKQDSIYLGYKKYVSVVEVNEHVLVIGVGDKDLTLLAKWKKADKSA